MGLKQLMEIKGNKGYSFPGYQPLHHTGSRWPIKNRLSPGFHIFRARIWFSSMPGFLNETSCFFSPSLPVGMFREQTLR